MDLSLNTVMLNCAHVKRNDVVLDPFCGSGSILLIASAVGAFTIGSDIDDKVLKGHKIGYPNNRLPHNKYKVYDVNDNFD